MGGLALSGLRLHAARAGGRQRLVAGRRAVGRIPGAAAHEPDGRRHVARHPAGRRGRLSAVGFVVGRDDAGRHRHRPGRGSPGGTRGAIDALARGREFCGFLSDLTGAGCAAGVVARLQYGSAARAVRHGPGPGRRGAAAGDHHSQRDLAGAGGDLPPAGGRMPGPQCWAP
ncbi:hypothetical protein G6F68_012762 [Rhizopus microsporus]|nr:hypothetical protein G6F68_012762 [Rhizopus microsporus]